MDNRIVDRQMNRLTLVVTGPSSVAREWTSPAETTNLMFLDSFQWLESMIASGSELDIARVVLESGAASPTEFLSLLAKCGEDFRGDVLLVDASGGGFLSAIGRGGERLLYSPTRDDVNFYLWAQGLTKLHPDELLQHPAAWSAIAHA